MEREEGPLVRSLSCADELGLGGVKCTAQRETLISDVERRVSVCALGNGQETVLRGA